jgi:hypothetical protein
MIHGKKIILDIINIFRVNILGIFTLLDQMEYTFPVVCVCDSDGSDHDDENYCDIVSNKLQEKIKQELNFV